jgi:hypothetical protein
MIVERELPSSRSFRIDIAVKFWSSTQCETRCQHTGHVSHVAQARDAGVHEHAVNHDPKWRPAGASSHRR